MAGKEDQIKTEIAVDGEQEYKKACKEIDASLKAIASEMKVVSGNFRGERRQHRGNDREARCFEQAA